MISDHLIRAVSSSLMGFGWKGTAISKYDVLNKVLRIYKQMTLKVLAP